ncbi:MAG: hypothetical protein DHS20C18_30380 [Saprospiraceae bacterium]|nr:MAG: hypothetical protein DHS20C18_30380 [Saprospiraceae bacterium]
MRSLILLIGLAFMFACGGSGTGGSIASGDLIKKRDILTSQEWRMAVEAILPMQDSLQLEGTEKNIFTNSLKQLQFATFSFYPDSNLSVNLNNGKDLIGGRWMFDNSGRELFLSFTMANPVPHPIEFLSKDSIVLGMNRDRGIIFPKIFVPLSENMGKKAETVQPAAEDTTGVSDQQ